jgi:hypothetical protein
VAVLAAEEVALTTICEHLNTDLARPRAQTLSGFDAIHKCGTDENRCGIESQNPGQAEVDSLKLLRVDFRGVRQGVRNQESEMNRGQTGICRLFPEMKRAERRNSRNSTCHSAVQFLGHRLDQRYFSVGELLPDDMQVLHQRGERI